MEERQEGSRVVGRWAGGRQGSGRVEGPAVGAEGSRRVIRVMPSPDDAFRSSHTLLSPASVCPHPAV